LWRFFFWIVGGVGGRYVAFACTISCGVRTYRAGFGYLEAVSESFAADDGGDLMHELLGISGVC